MNHVVKQLPAYHDGELGARAAQAVEAHLAQCEACRIELASLADLSTLLQVADPAPLGLSDDVFAAQVALRLPRDEVQTVSERTLAWSWRLAPVGIVVTWAFVQTTAIVALVVQLLMAAGMGNPALLALVASGPSLREPSANLANQLLGSVGLSDAWGTLQPVISSTWALLVPVLFSGLTAVAILSWVAVWWSSHLSSPVHSGQIG